MGFNYDNPDYDNYIIMFNEAHFPSNFNIFDVLDIGYKSIQASYKEIFNYNYTEFRLLITCFLFVILGIVTYKNCREYNLFLSIYLIFYLVLDEIQIRNFTSFVILLPFLIYYLSNLSKKSLILYILGVILAFTIHFSAIFYLIFSLLYIKSDKIRITILILAIIGISMIQYIISDLAMLDRVDNYAKPSILGVSAGIFLLVCNYLFIQKIISNKLSNKIRTNWSDTTLFCKPKTIININLILFILIPLLFMNATILRIFRFVSLINIMYLINLSKFPNLAKKQIRIIPYIIVYTLLISLWFNIEPGVYVSILNNFIF